MYLWVLCWTTFMAATLRSFLSVLQYWNFESFLFLPLTSIWSVKIEMSWKISLYNTCKQRVIFPSVNPCLIPLLNTLSFLIPQSLFLPLIWPTIYNPNLPAGLVGKVRKIYLPKEEGREGGEKSVCSAPAGPRARTRDLPHARRGSPAARHGGCLDKAAFPCL